MTPIRFQLQATPNSDDSSAEGSDDLDADGGSESDGGSDDGASEQDGSDGELRSREESAGPEGGSREASGGPGGGGGGRSDGRAEARWGRTVFTNTQTEEGTPLDELPQEELKVIPRAPRWPCALLTIASYGTTHLLFCLAGLFAQLFASGNTTLQVHLAAVLRTRLGRSEFLGKLHPAKSYVSQNCKC